MENTAKLYQLLKPLYQNLAENLTESIREKFYSELVTKRDPEFNCTYSLYLRKSLNTDEEIGITVSSNCQNRSHIDWQRDPKDGVYHLISDIYLEKGDSNEEFKATKEFIFEETTDNIDGEILSATQNLIEEGKKKIQEFIKENS